jgi:hypothetical protein
VYDFSIAFLFYRVDIEVRCVSILFFPFVRKVGEIFQVVRGMYL